MEKKSEGTALKRSVASAGESKEMKNDLHLPPASSLMVKHFSVSSSNSSVSPAHTHLTALTVFAQVSSQRRNDSFHLLLVFLFIPSLSASLLPPQVSYLPLSLQLFSLLQVGVSNTEIGEQTSADGRRSAI